MEKVYGGRNVNCIKNGIWILIEPPKSHDISGSKWVLRIKRDSNDIQICFMARVIARGFPQVPGIDFQDTFSPNLTNYDPPRIMQRLIHI